MSWSINITGNAEDVGDAFDDAITQAAANGMVEAEQQDIAAARDMAVHLAEKYERVTVNASGHWTVYGSEDPRNAFGRTSVSVDAATPPIVSAEQG